MPPHLIVVILYTIFLQEKSLISLTYQYLLFSFFFFFFFCITKISMIKLTRNCKSKEMHIKKKNHFINYVIKRDRTPAAYLFNRLFLLLIQTNRNISTKMTSCTLLLRIIFPTLMKV